MNSPTCSLFHLTVLQCMYERVHGKSSQNASEDELEEFKCTPSKQSVYPELDSRQVVAGNEAAEEPEAKEEDTEETQGPATEIQANTLAERLPTPEQPGDDWKPIFTSHAGLFIFDKSSERFLMQAEHVDIEIVEAGRFLCE